MALFVKQWAKTRNINDPHHGTLSSYGYILMLLHYLLNVADPPVVPNLQHCNLGVRELEWIQGCEVFYWRDEIEIAKAAETKGLTLNRQSTASLLREFFAYYTCEGYSGQGRNPRSSRFSWANDVVSIRNHGGLRRKTEKDWLRVKVDDTGTRHYYLLAIEDPFETNHNVGHTVNWRGVCAIRREFQRAYMIINRVKLIPGTGWEWRTDSGVIGEDFFAEPHRVMTQPTRGKPDDRDANPGELDYHGESHVASPGPLAVSKSCPQQRVKEAMTSVTSIKKYHASGNMSRKEEEQHQKVAAYATSAAQLMRKFLHDVSSENDGNVNLHTAIDKRPQNQISEVSENKNFSPSKPRTTRIITPMPMSLREMTTLSQTSQSWNTRGPYAGGIAFFSLDRKQLNDLEIIRSGGNGCMREVLSFDAVESGQNADTFPQSWDPRN
jgi:DNA polymerase sigma